ncbi:MAG: hypothetical protein AAF515_17860 [Pseudomonadota bacterium]
MSSCYRVLTKLARSATLGALLFGGASSALADDEAVIQLDETVISGNQELPKVLYIVPWQQPLGPPDLEVRHDFTAEDIFRPLYPPAHKREIRYYQSLSAAEAHADQEETNP